MFSKFKDFNLPLILSKSKSVCVLFNLLLLTLANISLANTIDYRYQKALKVQRLSLADGLSQSVVSDIIQDENGYIWLATEDGLNRYDSYNFEIFRHDFLDDNSLHENLVVSLLEEPGVGIWVGTARGMSFYDPLNDSFTNFSEQNPALEFSVLELHMDQYGVIWIATERGLFFIDKSREKVKRFVSSTEQIKPGAIFSISGAKNFIYVSGVECVFRIDLVSLAMVNLCDQHKLEELKGLNLRVVLLVEDTLWIGTDAGLYRYDLKSYSVQSFHHDAKNLNSLNDDYIQDLLLDNNGELWIATTEGVSVYDKNKQIFRHYTRKIYTEEGLSSNDILKLFVDEDGLMWLGTYTGGVNILDPNQNKFDHILTKSDVVDMGKNNTVYAIEKDSSDNLWIGTFGSGLFKYNLLSADISKPFNDANYEYEKFVYHLMIDSNNRLWMATQTELNILDLNTNTILKLRFVVDGNIVTSHIAARWLFEDNSGNIYIGSVKGLFKIMQIVKTKGITEIYLSDMTEELPKNFTQYDPTISTIVQDRHGDFWIGGEAGLIYYQVKLNQWTHFKYSKGNVQSLSNDSVQVILEDSQGFIWIGTGDGLNQVVRSKRGSNSIYFNRITTHDGLPSNGIYGILEDDNNQLWISTNSGIVKYESNSAAMDVYKDADGISSNEFNSGAQFADENGRLYFGSIDGVTVIKNKNFERGSRNKRLRYSHVLIGKRHIDVEELNSSERPKVVQGSDEVSINVRMVNINYDKLGTQRYRYRINGVSDNWNYLGTQRDIFITGLAEGDYELEVQSRLVGNDWISQSKLLSIKVNKSFWNSNQAIYVIVLAVLLIFALTVYYVYLFYRRKLVVTNKRVDVESLRLREIRIDKRSLGNDLALKEKEVAYLQNKVRLFEHRLDSEKYKDVATGFYRLSYLTKLTQRAEEDADNKKKTDNSLDYQSIAILELTNHIEHYKKYEFLAIAEYLSKVSRLIRKQMVSECQVFYVRDGIFLIVSIKQGGLEFEQSLIELSDIVRRTNFEFSNGVSENANIGFTSVDLTKINISNKSDLPVVTNRLLKLHSEMMNQSDIPNARNYYRITIRNLKVFMNKKADDFKLAELEQEKIIAFENI